MSASDKFSAEGDRLKGKAKEAFGKATGDDEKVAEGRGDQLAGDAKDAGAKLKDAMKDAFGSDS